MLKRILGASVVGWVFALTIGTATATTYDVDGEFAVPYPGATLTGTLTDDMTPLADLTVSGIPGTFTEAVYELAIEPEVALQITNPSNGDILYLAYNAKTLELASDSYVDTGPGCPPHFACFVIQDLSGTVTPTPLPTALPLFATGLAGLGLIGRCRKRKARAVTS